MDETTVEGLRLVLLRLARQLRRDAELEITPSQLSALTTIARWGPLRLGDLATREGVGSSTVTRLVERLAAAGWLERRADPADGRSTHVLLSRRGRAVLRSSRRRADEHLAARLSAMSEEDRVLLAACVPVLERLLEPEE